jgi:hypothetical protein
MDGMNIVRVIVSPTHISPKVRRAEPTQRLSTDLRCREAFTAGSKRPAREPTRKCWLK